MPLDAKEVRRRRSSSLVYTEPPESLEQLSDQAALPNLNAEWVNAKGQHSRLPGRAVKQLIGFWQLIRFWRRVLSGNSG